MGLTKKAFLALATTSLALSATFVSVPSKAQTTNPAGPAVTEPLVADTWWYVEGYVSTKEGLRLCPPGVALDTSSFTKPCGESSPVTVAQYFEGIKKNCPDIVPVSASPARSQSYRYFVLGFKDKGSKSCPVPKGAKLP
jgi:hypothetical protein